MNALIGTLEAISGSLLPWVLLGATVLLALLFGFLAWRRGSSNSAGHFSTNGGLSMARSRNGNQSDALRSMSDLQMTWAAKRNYVDTLRAGPILEGTFAGWFAEERELCDSFATAKQRLTDSQALREKQHPEVQQRYLSIVNETERKPHSALIYFGLLLLMAVEATGFSMIFADRINDSAPAQLAQQYGVLIAGALAALFLFFAHFTGVRIYRQGYAHAAHVLAPGASLARTVKYELGIGDDLEDKEAAQSTRIANRSRFVDHAAGAASLKNKITPRWPTVFWIYCFAVVVFACVVGAMRLAQIDEYYTKEAQRSASVAASENSQKDSRAVAVPNGVVQSKMETGDAITQEALDQERRGKQLAIGIFVMIFLFVQILGVLLASARGFASSKGETAYKGIREFQARHGDISIDQWKLELKSEAESAERYAQESLTGWQLGLQTAFTNKAMPVPNELFFSQCVRDFSPRAYSTFLQLKEHAAQTTTQTIATMSRFVPQHVHTPVPAVAAPAAPSIGKTDDMLVDFFVTSASGGEAVEQCSLSSLRAHILNGRFDNLATLNVRPSGQPDRFVPWVEFVRRGTQA